MVNQIKLRHRTVDLEAVRAVLVEVGRAVTEAAAKVDALDRPSVDQVNGALDVLDLIDERLRNI